MSCVEDGRREEEGRKRGRGAVADLGFLKGGSTARDRAKFWPRPHPVEARAHLDRFRGRKNGLGTTVHECAYNSVNHPENYGGREGLS